MRKLAAAIVAAFVVVSAPAFAACKADTEEAFMAMTVKAKLKVYTLRDTGQAKMRGMINAARSRNNGELLPDDAKLYFARLAGEATGIVFIAGGCVVPFSAMRLPSPAVAAMMNRAGVSDDEIIPANVEA